MPRSFIYYEVCLPGQVILVIRKSLSAAVRRDVKTKARGRDCDDTGHDEWGGMEAYGWFTGSEDYSCINLKFSSTPDSATLIDEVASSTRLITSVGCYEYAETVRISIGFTGSTKKNLNHFLKRKSREGLSFDFFFFNNHEGWVRASEKNKLISRVRLTDHQSSLTNRGSITADCLWNRTIKAKFQSWGRAINLWVPAWEQ